MEIQATLLIRPAVKRKITFFTLTLIMLIAMLVLFPGNAPAEKGDPIDNSIYAGLLKKHVKAGRVGYDGFKGDEALLDSYLAILSGVDADNLSRNAGFAFYINAYNAFTIKLILTNYPGINSIKEIGSFFSNPWSKKFISLEGRTVSLDHIEHDILRPRFKDPRIHFAINCAARGCPPLSNTPYGAKDLEAHLDKMTRSFVNNPNQTSLKGETLYISKIFKWFEEDFNDNPLAFIRQYATDEFRSKLDRAGSKIKISYLDYDWTLNRR
jgi:hypothetical protein